MNKQPVVTLYKYIGETPLEALDRLRLEKPELKDETLSYIGRLDPMAEGEMLVLVGDENKNRAKYLNLDKEYIVEILLGIATDSHDLLGKITNVSKKDIHISESIQVQEIKEALKAFEKTFLQEYPKYSSKIISNPELLESKPTKEVTIYSIELIHQKSIPIEEVGKHAVEKIAKVKGNFRQEELIKQWQNLADNSELKNKKLILIKVKVLCSSGTYMRSLAENLGNTLGFGGLAYSIVRTKISYPQQELDS